MSALVLDAGALVAADRGDRAVMSRLRAAAAHNIELRTTSMVVAQVWRDDRGRQVSLGRLLAGVDVRAIDGAAGRRAGVLLAETGTSDPIDATVAMLAERGDHILTSDPRDLSLLARAVGRGAVVVAC